MYCHSHFLRPDEIPKVTFYCPRKEGAVLCLPVQAKRKNTVASADFGKWIIKHIDHWFTWARQLGLGISRMEDLILVTGTHCTRSCTNVAFPGGQGDALASFGAKVDHRSDGVAINWQFSHELIRGVELNCGPDGEVWLYTACAARWILKYCLRDLVPARTYRRISASSYEGFVPLVSSGYCRRSLRGRQDPNQTQRDTTRGQTRNSSRSLLYQR